MKELKATRLVAVLGVSAFVVSSAFAQVAAPKPPKPPKPPVADYIDDATGKYSAAAGIAEYNDDINYMCNNNGPDQLQGKTPTGNAAESNWVEPLCPSAG